MEASLATALVEALGNQRGSAVYASKDDVPVWHGALKPTLDCKAIALRIKRRLEVMLPDQEERYQIHLTSRNNVLVEFDDGSWALHRTPQ